MDWSPQLCLGCSYLDVSDETVLVWLHLKNYAHRPFVPWCILVLNENDVVDLEVALYLVPLGTFLQSGQVLLSPSRPKQVTQVLDSAPTTMHVDIKSLELSRRGQDDACFHGQNLIWGERYWVLVIT